MKSLIAICIVIAGCAAPDYSHLTFEQRMQVYEAAKLRPQPIEPVYFLPMDEVQQKTMNCMAISNNQIMCY